MQKVLFLLVFIVFFGAISVGAHAQDPRTGIHVQIQPIVGNGRLCVDAWGDRVSDGTPVRIYQCHGSENQRWTISSSPTNEHAILGIGGFCLDVRGNGAANGTPSELYQCHFGANQRFAFRPDGRIVEVRSGKCLTVSGPGEGAPLVLNNCANIPQEVFAIRP